MEAMRMRERRSGELRAWGISLVVHVLLFLLIGASGFFLLVREQPQPSEDDVVDVTMLDDADGGGDGGERAPSAAPASAASAEAPAVTLPPETKLPEIAETYTKEPEKQQAYRKEHQEHPAAMASSAAAADDAAGAGQSTGDSGTAKGAGSGDGTGRGAGSGAGNGTGSGAGDGGGVGAGVGAGTGTAPVSPPEPVDAGAYCTYRATPAYPQSMVQAGAQGSVTVLITVSPASAVTDVSVVSSSGYPALDAAAVAAGWACRFQMNGHSGRYRTTYRFELRGGDDDW